MSANEPCSVLRRLFAGAGTSLQTAHPRADPDRSTTGSIDARFKDAVVRSLLLVSGSPLVSFRVFRSIFLSSKIYPHPSDE